MSASSLEQLEKRSIRALTPYQVAPRSKESTAIYLDANENPYPREFTLSSRCFNRYPEPQPVELLQRYADYLGVQPNNLLVSLGGDEAIKLIIEAFCNNDADAILFSSPTFGMYGIDAQVVGAKSINVPLDKNFNIDVQGVIEASKNAKVVFICSPNNPTGNLMPIADIEAILNATARQSIVVLDEAYIEFADRISFATRLQEFPHLAIIRTLSKAFGVAGIRCGFTVANPELIHILQKVIAPYPIPQPVVEIAKEALSNDSIQSMQKIVAKINQHKAQLRGELATLPCVTQVYPSDANFLLVALTDANRVSNHLQSEQIYVKKQSGVLENMIRISIGTHNENARLIQTLKNYAERE